MAPRLHAAAAAAAAAAGGGRRQRRGYVGSTNLGGQRECDGHVRGEQTRATSQRSCDVEKQQPAVTRKKFALPLLQPSPCSHVQSGRVTQPRSCEASPDEGERGGESGHADGRVEKALGEHIARVQHNAKSFKDEPWYKSPIGFGSSASVVHAALKQLDARGTGFVRCHEIVEALQGVNFGLKEHEVRSLIATYDSALRDDSAVNFAAFAKKIKLPRESDYDGRDDRVLRQQTFVERIREHAQQLAMRASPQKSASTAPSSKLLSRSPEASVRATFLPVASVEEEEENGDGRLRNNDESNSASRGLREMLTGSNSAFKALPTIPKPLKRAANANEELLLLSSSSPIRTGHEEGVDRLSFEFDKKRRENRANTKAGILLAHINRVEAFAKREQVVAEQHENLRLAAKAMHRHEHYARLLKEEQHNTLMVEKQCKGLVGSDLTRMNRSVSKDSIFYVEPTLS